MSSLETLLGELTVHIITFLDPIALIALSQTGTYFRRIINPGRQELVERLLQLELTEQHGGPAYTYRARDFAQLQRLWASEEWLAIRWACTDCLRLLSHTHFDNISLHRLAYRKPGPDSHAANPATSWRPSISGKQWSSRKQRAKSLEEASIRLRYRIASEHQPPNDQYDAEDIRFSVEKLRLAGFVGLEDMDQEQFRALSRADRQAIFDRNADAIELQRCGSKRHLRKCNECRYQRGQLGRGYRSRRVGTPTFPIMRSRTLYFQCALHRYFPQVWAQFESPRPSIDELAVLFTVSRESDKYWTMYMARCPQCQRWQELSSFRIGGDHPRWKPAVGYSIGSSQVPADLPSDGGLLSSLFRTSQITAPLLDNAQCDSCFARAHGSRRLFEELSTWVEKLFRGYRTAVENGMTLTLSPLCLGDHIPKETRAVLKGLFDEVEIIKQLGDNRDKALRSHHCQFTQVWNSARESAGNPGWSLVFQGHDWQRDFDKYAAHWDWVTARVKELEEYPDKLAPGELPMRRHRPALR